MLSSMNRARPGGRGGVVDCSCRGASCSSLMTRMQQEMCQGYPVAEILRGREAARSSYRFPEIITRTTAL
jgi:hypothetical protein